MHYATTRELLKLDLYGIGITGLVFCCTLKIDRKLLCAQSLRGKGLLPRGQMRRFSAAAHGNNLDYIVHSYHYIFRFRLLHRQVGKIARSELVYSTRTNILDNSKLVPDLPPRVLHASKISSARNRFGRCSCVALCVCDLPHQLWP